MFHSFTQWDVERRTFDASAPHFPNSFVYVVCARYPLQCNSATQFICGIKYPFASKRPQLYLSSTIYWNVMRWNVGRDEELKVGRDSGWGISLHCCPPGFLEKWKQKEQEWEWRKSKNRVGRRRLGWRSGEGRSWIAERDDFQAQHSRSMFGL